MYENLDLAMELNIHELQLGIWGDGGKKDIFNWFHNAVWAPHAASPHILFTRQLRVPQPAH